MASIKPDTPVEVADIPGRSVLVLYGSETGNSQDIAEELGRTVQRLHFKTKVDEMNAIKLSETLRYTLVIFVLSTTGQGDMPQNSLIFWKSLLRKKLAPGCMGTLKFTTFGLGDSSYPRFNWAVRKLHKRLGQLGAEEFYSRGEGDEQDDDGIDEAFLPWSTGLRAKLLEQYPLPDGLTPIPDEALLPPRYTLPIGAHVNLRNVHEPDGFDEVGRRELFRRIENLGVLEVVRDSTPEVPFLENPAAKSHYHPPPLSAGAVMATPDSVLAILDANDRVTPAGHWQDVRLIRLELYHFRPEPLSIHPGDCVRLYPRNSPEDVDRLIKCMDWADVADRPLDLEAIGGELATGLYTDRHTTLRRLLTENLDITAIPRRSFLEAISHHCTDVNHKERLVEFSKVDYVDEYYDYATRPRRTILEVLEDFQSVKIPPAYALDVFPIIRGRDFSIASIRPSPSAHPGATANSPYTAYTVELLVALVKYQTVLRKIRTGLCSRYLTSLSVGAPVLAAHKPSLTRLNGPLHAQRPLCALATGTGIAPVRALVQERLSYDKSGRAVLFFGNRSREKDYYFADEWAALPTEKLRVFTAFSRDQKEKIYIQDIVRQKADVVAELVREDAIFIVCGGSSKMAMACRDAVIACMRKTGVCDTDGKAQDLFAQLTWWQEIW
ncbi:riboflavin synthase domain-like protein [Sodiomyces alkalinus F11]|uniref:NADPH-dependent diflavin oxidoreductase 1 n=1 Tax=Sodiomyces alkalinus (strain CBS 110278 / VKM F-3762 / F11) TaxID=1314773 RepID=A0A3N2PY31_SODAK|nr:riboflavin synthase domain-like protein [Sodiomyces alkalinus F11]ROT39449.1 riboflavin synthase domain-like protein [Sodiomyces alkalinus F11]